MSACVFLCVWFVLCVCVGLDSGCSPVQGVLPTEYRIKNLENRPGSNGLQSHIYIERELGVFRFHFY
jgi:hypothetical protein